MYSGGFSIGSSAIISFDLSEEFSDKKKYSTYWRRTNGSATQMHVCLSER